MRLDNIDLQREIRLASVADIPGIIAVLKQNLMVYKKNHELDSLEQTGFLLGEFTDEYAQTAITNTQDFIFLISQEDDQVVGYAMGCDVRQLESEFQDEMRGASAQLNKLLRAEKTFYLKQIAKQAEKKFVGTGLLQTLVELVRQAGYKNIVCIIAEKPLQNKASKSFHEKYGFECEGFYPGGDKVFGVYLKKL